MSICGFLIIASYNRVNASIENLNKDMLEMRLQISQIQSSIIDEQKVKEIIEVELLKHGIK